MRKVIGYNVYYCVDGCEPEFCGFEATKHAARKLARGPRLPKYLWGTARAAGHVNGITAPEGPEADEPVEWFGRGNNFCLIPVFEAGQSTTLMQPG